MNFSMLFKYRFFKSIADRVLSLILIVVLLPLLFVLSFSVFAFLGSPIIFVQERAGQHGAPFYLFKFRSMKNYPSDSGHPLSDSERLTPFGVFLRSTSLDELPSLFNVLIGDMSFVGPRPLLLQYLPLYTPAQALRHTVKPGISGFAQIRGRNLLSWTEKFNLDTWYVSHQSFFLDFFILIATPLMVIRREGISAPGEATMAPFTGSSDRV